MFINTDHNVRGASHTVGAVGADYTKIQDAINASNDGDTIYVWAGTYTENITVNRSVSIIGNSSVDTIINGTAFFTIENSSVCISGFNFSIFDDLVDTVNIWVDDGLSNISIYDNVFTYYGGIIFEGCASDINISDNVFNTYVGMLYYDTPSFINDSIINNNVFSPSGNAINFLEDVVNLTFSYNVVNSVEGGAVYTHVINSTFSNNVFSLAETMFSFEAIENSTISHNNFSENGESVYIDSYSYGLNISNNVFSHGGVDIYNAEGDNLIIIDNVFNATLDRAVRTDFCDDVVISNNVFTNLSEGIELILMDTNDDVVISNNIFSHSENVQNLIITDDSTFVNINNNSFFDINTTGFVLDRYMIDVYQSSNITVRDNTLSESDFYMFSRFLNAESTDYSTFSHNTIDFIGTTEDGYSMYFDECHHNIVEYNNITDGTIGIAIKDSSYFTVRENNFYDIDEHEGSHALGPDNLIKSFIYNNTFDGNLIAIFSNDDDEAPENYTYVYNNLFLNSTWDHTYTEDGVDRNIRYNVTPYTGTNIVNGPSIGGNYWDDYTGSDGDYDGFGDIPRSYLGECGFDWYPLVEPDTLIINVYNESNCSEAITDFDIQVSNFRGTEVYIQENCDSVANVPILLCPTGEKVSVLVSSIGYKQRVYYLNLSYGDNVVIDAYLPPSYTNILDDVQEEDCSLRSFTNSINVSNPSSDATITYSHLLDSMISVEIYNKSLYTSYGGWYYVSENYYSTTNSVLTIDKAILDSNTTIARVSYYYLYCPSQTIETPLYYLRVVEETSSEFTDAYKGVDDVYVSVKRYMSCEDKYVNVSVLLTDANGYCNVFLIPGVLYKVEVNDDSYNYMISDYIPASPNEWGQTTEKVFKIEPTIPDIVNYDPFSITITGTIKTNGSLYVVYRDDNGGTIDWKILVYENYNGTLSLNATHTGTNNSYSFYLEDINTSRSHLIKLFYNNTANFMPTYNPPLSYSVLPSTTWGIDSTPFDLESRIESIFGENDLGWVNIVAVSLTFLVLASLSPFNVGLGLISSGITLGLTQALLMTYVDPLNINPLLWVLVFVLILLGILYFMTKGEGGIGL